MSVLQAANFNPGTAALSLAGNAVGGLLKAINPFDSSGPDAKKWDYRKTNINASIAAAKAGNIHAYWALGAYGQRQPNPVNWDRRTVPGMVADSDPGKGVDYIFNAGWTSREWGGSGGAYDPLIKAARDAYDALTPGYAAVPQAVTVAKQGGTFQIPIVGNVGNGNFANNDFTSNPAGTIPGTSLMPDTAPPDTSGPFTLDTATVSPWVVPGILVGVIVTVLGVKAFKRKRG